MTIRYDKMQISHLTSKGVFFMTEKEKSYAELLYQPNDPELTQDRNVTVRKLQDYNNMDPLDYAGREEAIRGILGKAGKNCVVQQPLFCTYGYNTCVGDNFFLNVNGKLMDSGKITIGDNSVIGAGSVVTKDIPANSLAVGNPCRVIRTLEQNREN